MLKQQTYQIIQDTLEHNKRRRQCIRLRRKKQSDRDRQPEHGRQPLQPVRQRPQRHPQGPLPHRPRRQVHALPLPAHQLLRRQSAPHLERAPADLHPAHLQPLSQGSRGVRRDMLVRRTSQPPLHLLQVRLSFFGAKLSFISIQKMACFFFS